MRDERWPSFFPICQVCRFTLVNTRNRLECSSAQYDLISIIRNLFMSLVHEWYHSYFICSLYLLLHILFWHHFVCYPCLLKLIQKWQNEQTLFRQKACADDFVLDGRQPMVGGDLGGPLTAVVWTTSLSWSALSPTAWKNWSQLKIPGSSTMLHFLKMWSQVASFWHHLQLGLICLRFILLIT